MVNKKLSKTRCHWCTSDPLYTKYHDIEWGVPVYQDRLLFEFLILEGMQAGLSWFTILKKRPAFRKAFSHFNPKNIAEYDSRKIKELLANPGIIRNKLKIHAAITNAKAFLAIKEEGQSFAEYVWKFVDGKPIDNKRQHHHQIPGKTAISDAMSKDLKKRGFKFVGSTICYAFMQAVGMVNDHTIECYRYREIKKRW